MLIKITKSCSNGCTHCLNDSKLCDEHMTLDTFKDVLRFCLKYDNDKFGNLITGGEPTEHPQFLKFIDTYYSIYPLNNICTITTNGHWILNHQEETLDLLNKYPFLFFQVTYDSRYYPKKLDTTKRILRHPRICGQTGVCTVEHIYPQGRALINRIPASSAYNNPKCGNLKLIAAQSSNYELKEILEYLRMANNHCIPAIAYDGKIEFGESDLCPKLCSIYDDEKKIVKEMLFNDCNRCPLEISNNTLKSKILYGRARWRQIYGD